MLAPCGTSRHQAHQALETIQHRAARWSLDRYPRTSSKNDMLTPLVWPYLQSRHQTLQLLQVQSQIDHHQQEVHTNPESHYHKDPAGPIHSPTLYSPVKQTTGSTCIFRPSQLTGTVYLRKWPQLPALNLSGPDYPLWQTRSSLMRASYSWMIFRVSMTFT